MATTSTWQDYLSSIIGKYALTFAALDRNQMVSILTWNLYHNHGNYANTDEDWQNEGWLAEKGNRFAVLDRELSGEIEKPSWIEDRDAAIEEYEAFSIFLSAFHRVAAYKKCGITKDEIQILAPNEKNNFHFDPIESPTLVSHKKEDVRVCIEENAKLHALKKVFAQYKKYLTDNPNESLAYQNRFTAVNEACDYLQNKVEFKKVDTNFLQGRITIIENNKPSWHERNFLDKLTDILTFGLKPLYRKISSALGFFPNQSAVTLKQALNAFNPPGRGSEVEMLTMPTAHKAP